MVGSGRIALRCMVLVLLLAGASLPGAFADERILSFHSRIVVERNGDLLVTETIQVRAQGHEIRRGIYRDLPGLRATKFGMTKMKPFEVLSVKRDGEEEPREVSEIGKGGIRIRIGRADRFLPLESNGRVFSNTFTYEITYRTAQQLYLEEDRDVLYWNVNGTEWDFAADKVSASVVLPEGIKGTAIRGYTGKRRKRGEDFRAELIEAGATIAATRPFGPRENLTLELEWLPGLLDEKAYREARVSFWQDHPLGALGLLLLLTAFAYYVAAWVCVGRDSSKGVIIPRYFPPVGFSAAAVRYLDKMGYDQTCFSAGVLGLAAKKQATIKKDGQEYTLRPNSGRSVALTGDEKDLRKKLFRKGPLELNQSNHVRIERAREGHRKALGAQLETVLFVRNLGWWVPGLLLSLSGGVFFVFAIGPSLEALFILGLLSMLTLAVTRGVAHCVSHKDLGRGLLLTLFFVAFWGVLLVLMIHLSSPWVGGAMLYAAILNQVFYHLIKAPTKRGKKIMDEIEGFRSYMSVAEEERLNRENPPERTPELFERFLPYALALGCEQQWSEKFDGVLRAAGVAPGQSSYSPSYYSGSADSLSGTMNDLSGSFTGSLSSSASAPSSGGSGGGGGGGSSGGGGGGGGGGGW